MYYLIAYWFIFWWSKLKNPYQLCTSELASTYFPHWIWMGKTKNHLTDNIYYKEPGSIPFLSSFYPTKVISSKIGRFLTLNSAFKLFSYEIIAHYLLFSILAYKATGSLFCAVTMAYSGYMIKPQTPAFVYTAAWIPGCFLGGWFGAFSFGMAILGGYWPILVYVVPVIAFVSPFSLFGVIIGLLQIPSFLAYWPKSVRSGLSTNRDEGKLSLSHLRNILFPSDSVMPINGIHYPEYEMYMGIAALFIFHASWWWIALIFALSTVVGINSSLQRIPCRSLYLFQISVCFLSIYSFSLINYKTQLILLLLQSFFLLRNASIYPSFPFSQWWKKPSEIYAGKRDVSKFPFQSGYLFNDLVPQYAGGFALRG